MGYLYFVRHGETSWNTESRVCGVTDLPLTKFGHEQAVMTGEKILESGIYFDEIISSPLIRARQTAEHISQMTGKPVRIDDRLREHNFGIYEGRPRLDPEFRQSKQRFADRYGCGESLLMLGQRVYNLIDEIKADPDGKIYLLVSHNGVARMVNTYFHDMANQEYAVFGIQNCEVVKFEWQDRIS